MNKNISFLIILTLYLLLQRESYAEENACPPSEIIVLKLHDNNYRHWREICRNVTEKDGCIEYIPTVQTPENWSELIAIQYKDLSALFKGNNIWSLEEILSLLKKTTQNYYPGAKVTWNIIEKNKNSIIYEWILHKPYKKVPPQHEIARAFLTETGFHRIGFTRRNREMTPDEQNKWIKLFRESAMVVSLEEAIHNKGLSMADKVKDTLDIKSAFPDWEVLLSHSLPQGYSSTCFVPSSQKESYITEGLEVITMPDSHASIELIFEGEKQSIQKKFSEEIKYDILKQSLTEWIYSYSHPRDLLRVTSVTRAFITDQGYYSVSYKFCQPTDLDREKILYWKERLETIKFKDRSLISKK